MPNIERGGTMELVAGPCSITPENIKDILQLSQIRVKNLHGIEQPALWGTRMVELKSRTALDPSGEGMGIGCHTVMENMLILTDGGSSQDFKIPESVNMMKKVIEDTELTVATEVMMPSVQVPIYEKVIPDGKMLLWNPSVEQLGWSILPMAVAAKRHNWEIGLKNGKWLGATLKDAEQSDSPVETNLEKTWVGLTTFATAMGLPKSKITLIHRGVDIPEKGEFRNIPIHEVARRAKRKIGGGVKLYFDPSHTFGPNLRDQIVEGTVQAMLMKDGNEWLYDGALIEAGTAPTDTGQHLTINEMESLAKELAKYRNLRASQK